MGAVVRASINGPCATLLELAAGWLLDRTLLELGMGVLDELTDELAMIGRELLLMGRELAANDCELELFAKLLLGGFRALLLLLLLLLITALITLLLTALRLWLLMLVGLLRLIGLLLVLAAMLDDAGVVACELLWFGPPTQAASERGKTKPTAKRNKNPFNISNLIFLLLYK